MRIDIATLFPEMCEKRRNRGLLSSDKGLYLR